MFYHVGARIEGGVTRPLPILQLAGAPALILGFLLVTGFAHASALDNLRAKADLTPELLMAHFRGFTFKLREKVQDPEVFLATREGDCDDFASLAAELLRGRNFNPRLVAVFMDGQTHVVCYIKEVGGYLDYNRRDDHQPVQPSNGSLEDIADQVAAYFRVPWHCVAEFTSVDGSRHFSRIAFR
jgi:hypothetical protein